MFQWYKAAGICFAYLADVPPNVGPGFSRSEWFTRGWTLQELLAPSEVIFLANDWSEITSKSKSVSRISDVTGIPSDFLLGEDLEHASVAMRMSWASNRETTKSEDIAYCLLGIFDIQMPLLYGEREAGAFRRLQQEILNTSDDQSIFAWTTDDGHTPLYNAKARQTFSLLAHSPASFKACRNMVEAEAPVVPGYLKGIRTPTIFNNKGLHLSLPTIPKEERRVIAILNCCEMGREDKERTAIWLRDVSTNGGRYIRVKRQKLERIPMSAILSSAKYSSISAIKGEDEDLDEARELEPTQNVIGPASYARRPSGGLSRISKEYSRTPRHPRIRSSTNPDNHREHTEPWENTPLLGSKPKDISTASLFLNPISLLKNSLLKCLGQR